MKIKSFSTKIFVLIFYFFVLFLPSLLFAQDYKNIFASPMKIPLYSTGNFAELRGSHFHSGLDIRTYGKTGYSVYAPEDGYVSRIKVQAYGGGKNLYITHQNGYTTVYMHLERYCGEIEQWVKNHQYANQVYEFDYTFSNPKIYIKQGDTIAISGESGSVAGPHLHFEVRNSKTENPINPLRFLDMEDTIPPFIESLAITPMKNASVNNSANTYTWQINKDNNFNDSIPSFDTIDCLGNIYFSILAFDPSKNSSMRNGVLSSELYINNNKIFSHKVNEFSFANYGYVDAVINYPLYIKTGKRYLSSRLLENGKLPYDNYVNNGILNVKKDSIYKIEWKLSDIKNNKSNYVFFVRGYEKNNAIRNNTLKPRVMHIDYNENSTYKASDGSLFMFSKNCLYESIDLEHYERKGTYSNVHTLHNVFEPVKKKFTIKIKPYKVDNLIKDKSTIVKINSKGGLSSVGGYYKDGFVETKIGDFGVFAIWIDTTAPTIKPINFKPNKKLSDKQQTLKVKIADNLTGIFSYKGYLNGKWVLMEYDGKNAMLTYFIDETLKEGENTLKIVVTDKNDNSRTETYKIIK